MKETASEHSSPENGINFPLFSQISSKEHEQVIYCSDQNTNLKAIIAIHNTTIGPALGGVRLWPYQTEEEATNDVLRLSRGMTYKNAISGLGFGGGKAVIMGGAEDLSNEAKFRAFGRFVEGLGGRYLTAKDVGVNLQVMEWIYAESSHVTCIPEALGGSGDPSPVTAYGVYTGMKACAKKAYGSDSLKNKRIAIQGAGHVATGLAERLAREEAKLFISDIFPEKAQKLSEKTGAEVVDPEKIHELDVDIFSPCALGAAVNDQTIGRLACDIIAGGANNILDQEERHGKMLLERGIIYAPDYVINAGGVINISGELEGYNRERAYEKTSRIYDTVLKILDVSEREQIPTTIASNHIAERRIQQVGEARSIFTHPGRR